MPAELENSAVATGHRPQDNVSFHSNTKEGNAKEYSKYCAILLISHVSKIKPQIVQVRLQQHVNLELPDVQAGFRKGRGIRDQIASICWITGKAREFQKNITSISLTMLQSLTVWITTSCGKFLNRREYHITLPENRESQE